MDNSECVNIWNACLEKLEKDASISALSLDVFIKQLDAVDFKDGNLILHTGTSANKQVIVKNYLKKMQEVLNTILPNTAIILIDQTDNSETPAPQIPLAATEFPPDLNPKQTFDNFVVGKNNQFVYAAARAVTDSPGGAYNPLFIHGGVGLGKTHIMHAVGNYIISKRPELKVIYVTCERFTNEFIDSIRLGKEGSPQSFRNRYRTADILMIDDIQFIANKTGTQEEFFHTFNDLHNHGKQIIISSDRPPREISHLEERLRSRFGGGLIADIQPPDIENRIAILRKKAQENGYNIPPDVIEYIAELNDENIRVMLEYMTRAYFFSKLHEVELTVDVASQALKYTAKDNNESLSIDVIIDVVARYYNVSRDDLIGKKKNREIVYPRQMCIYLITEIMPMPLASIGELLGGRDHTTIMHARDKIASELKNNPAIKLALQEIRNLIFKK